jgi:hypothetical protein
MTTMPVIMLMGMSESNISTVRIREVTDISPPFRYSTCLGDWFHSQCWEKLENKHGYVIQELTELLTDLFEASQNRPLLSLVAYSP